MKGFIPVDIPTKPYIAAYLRHKYGTPPVLNAGTLVGDKLYDVLQHGTNERKLEYNPDNYPVICKLYVNRRTFLRRGANLNETNLQSFNNFCEKQIKWQFFFLMDTYCEMAPYFMRNLPMVREKLGIDVEAWSDDSMQKAYYRYRKSKKAKLFYKKPLPEMSFSRVEKSPLFNESLTREILQNCKKVFLMKPMYSDLTLATGPHKGGLCQLAIVPKEALASDITPDFETGNIKSAIQLIAGWNWTKIGLLHESYDYDAKPKTAAGNAYFDITVSGKSNNLTPDTIQVLKTLQYSELIAQVQDREGYIHIIGNRQRGARLTFEEHHTGTNGGEKTYTIEIAISQEQPAAYYTV